MRVATGPGTSTVPIRNARPEADTSVAADRIIFPELSKHSNVPSMVRLSVNETRSRFSKLACTVAVPGSRSTVGDDGVVEVVDLHVCADFDTVFGPQIFDLTVDAGVGLVTAGVEGLVFVGCAESIKQNDPLRPAGRIAVREMGLRGERRTGQVVKLKTCFTPSRCDGDVTWPKEMPRHVCC